jgi:hypothetical protein
MQLTSLSDLHVDHPGNGPVIDAMIGEWSGSPDEVARSRTARLGV